MCLHAYFCKEYKNNDNETEYRIKFPTKKLYLDPEQKIKPLWFCELLP